MYTKNKVCVFEKWLCHAVFRQLEKEWKIDNSLSDDENVFAK